MLLFLSLSLAETFIEKVLLANARHSRDRRAMVTNMVHLLQAPQMLAGSMLRLW